MSAPTPPLQSQTFRAASWLAPFLTAGGLFFTGMTLLALMLPVLDPNDPVSRGPTRFVYAAILGGFAGLSFYSVLHIRRYRFTLGPRGFTETPRHDSREVIPWSRVASVRPRPVMQRLELRGAGGELLAALEYHVQDLQIAFGLVLEHVPRAPVVLPSVFKRHMPWGARILLALLTAPLVGLGAWLWLRDGQLGGLFLLLLFVAVFVLERLTTLSRTIVAADGVVLVRGPWRTHVPWTEVTRVELVARPGQNGARNMDVALHLHSGRTRFLLPGGADLAALNHAAEMAYGEHAKRGAA